MVVPVPLEAAVPPPDLRSSRSGSPAVVVHAFLDFNDGGAQRLTLAACRHLRRDRFAPSLLCVRGDGRLVPAALAAGLPVVTLDRLRRSWDIPAPRTIAQALRSLGTRILHVPLYSRASPYVRLAARHARVPLVVAHEWSRPEPPRLLRRLADRWLRAGTLFVAASEAQRSELIASGARRDRIEVVRAGVECEEFAAGDRDATRAALGAGAEEILALVPARLHPAKGQLDLLALLPRILVELPRLRLLLAGDGPARAAIERAVRELGLAARVELLGSRDDMPNLYAAADLVALPSRVEGLPSVILEAFAASRAVVATAVGGVAEALRDGEEGRLVPARSPEALRAAIVELASDRELRRAMGERGRRRAFEAFHVRDATRRLEAVYERWTVGASCAGAA